jgi:hypothetical protein
VLFPNVCEGTLRSQAHRDRQFLSVRHERRAGLFLDGGNNYRRTVPANVRVKQYWVERVRQEEDLLRAKDAGFNYHPVKPIPPDSLIALLDSLV